MNKILMIFGANGALGKGLTNTFLTKDYGKVFLLDLKFGEKHSDERVTKIETGDLTYEENVINIFSKIPEGKSNLLFLYSTVGGFFGGPEIASTELKDFDKMISMNLKSSFLLAKHFAKKVQVSAGGSILFTSALTSLNPEKGKSVYGASKEALNYLVKTLALEGENINLSVNAIAPSIIDTTANREWAKKDNFDDWMKPEEIGELADLLFRNFHFVSGNIIKLKHRFVVK